MRIELTKISGVVASFVAALLGPLFNATVAPAQILGEQDGQWDRNSYKTDLRKSAERFHCPVSQFLELCKIEF